MRLQPYNILYKHVWTTVSHSRVTLVIFNGGSKSPITRKKNIGPPTIYYKNCHNRGLAHVPCMTRTPIRYPRRFILVWCVGLDLRSAPNNWGHSKPTPGYVCGLCVPRSQLGPTDPRNYKIWIPIKTVKMSLHSQPHCATATGFHDYLSIVSGETRSQNFQKMQF